MAQQKGDDSDQGCEADNDAENNDLIPRSAPTIYNFTPVGGSQDGDESDIGMLLREGTAGHFANFIVTGFKEVGLELDDRATFTQAAAGELAIASAVFFGNGQNFSEDAEESPTPPFSTLQWATRFSPNISEADPQLRAHLDLENPDYRPADGSPAVDGTVPPTVPPDDDFFELVSYIGAMDAVTDWTDGWTTSAQN